MSNRDASAAAGLFRIRQCESRVCGFRYPAPAGLESSGSCPLCRGPASYASQPFGGRSDRPFEDWANGLEVEVLLDNLRSSYNVGSIFRTCDGAGVRHVHLCGITSTPKQRKVAKTALGADVSVAWTYHRNGLKAVRSLKEDGIRIWAMERNEQSRSILDFATEILESPVLLVVGNEVAGIDPGILQESDRIVSVPMLGSKSSLNAVVAFGVAVYWLRFGMTMPNA